MRVWHTAPDEKVCSICAPMNGKKTPIDQPWTTGSPPVHPLCRCDQRLDFGEESTAALDRRTDIPSLGELAQSLLEQYGPGVVGGATEAMLRAVPRTDAETAAWLEKYGEQAAEYKRIAGRASGSNEWIGSRTDPDALRLKEILDQAPRMDEPLYRGMSMWAEDIPRVGSEYQLNLSSFSRDRGVAASFADANSVQAASDLANEADDLLDYTAEEIRDLYPGTERVVFEVRGARGLPLDALAHTHEQEVLTGGRFRVTSVRAQRLRWTLDGVTSEENLTIVTLEPIS